jgi:hypothetical protein
MTLLYSHMQGRRLEIVDWLLENADTNSWNWNPVPLIDVYPDSDMGPRNIYVWHIADNNIALQVKLIFSDELFFHPKSVHDKLFSLRRTAGYSW